MKIALTLATTAVTAAMLGVGAGAAHADADLVLWSQHNQTGDSLGVPALAEGCVPLDGPFATLSADNRANRTFDAELFLNDDCTGSPAETIAAGHKKNFRHSHNTASVNFVQP